MAGSAGSAQGELLEGSNVNQVYRIGDTVRRSRTGSWTPAIHALLHYLEAAGFDGAPRALGMDEDGREILTYVPGEPAALFGARVVVDDVVVAAGGLLRRYHDTVATFTPPADAAWQDSWFDDETARSIAPWVAPSVAAVVVCHNDAAPHNTIVSDGVPVAFIDWDFARPAPRAWDLAYGMKTFAPLPSAEPSLPPAERGRRMRRFCDGYGVDDRRGLLDAAALQIQSLFTALKTKAEQGDPYCVKVWRATGGRSLLADMAYLAEHRAALLSALG